MAKSKQMQIVKGVFAQQHIEIHSIVYSGDANDRQVNLGFARWGSKSSFEAAERPLYHYPVVTLRGPALAMFNRQGNLLGAAWATLELVLSRQVPSNLSEHIQFSHRDLDELLDAQSELSEGQEPFLLDMSEPL